MGDEGINNLLPGEIKPKCWLYTPRSSMKGSVRGN